VVVKLWRLPPYKRCRNLRNLMGVCGNDPANVDFFLLLWAWGLNDPGTSLALYKNWNSKRSALQDLLMQHVLPIVFEEKDCDVCLRLILSGVLLDAPEYQKHEAVATACFNLGRWVNPFISEWRAECMHVLRVLKVPPGPESTVLEFLGLNTADESNRVCSVSTAFSIVDLVSRSPDIALRLHSNLFPANSERLALFELQPFQYPSVVQRLQDGEKVSRNALMLTCDRMGLARTGAKETLKKRILSLESGLVAQKQTLKREREEQSEAHKDAMDVDHTEVTAPPSTKKPKTKE
jgi:hypothetical protein